MNQKPVAEKWNRTEKDSIKIFWCNEFELLCRWKYFTDTIASSTSKTIQKWKLSTTKACRSDSQVCMLILAFSALRLELESNCTSEQRMHRNHDVAHKELPRKSYKLQFNRIKRGVLLLFARVVIAVDDETRSCEMGSKLLMGMSDLNLCPMRSEVIEVDDLFGSR